MIRGAARGRAEDRTAFAARYERVVRAYLGARWRGSPLLGELEDAVQDAFEDCLRPGGALERADANRGAFRAFLYGVVRNVALRHERTWAQAADRLDSSFEPATDEPSLAEAFDRAWAHALLRDAARLQRDRARGDPRAERRVDLMRLRFRDGLPIREIAAAWGEEPRIVHQEYATARREFREALRSTVAFHRPGGTPAELEQECRRLAELFA